MKSIIASTFLALSLASTAQANLIVNGDFEEPQLSGHSWKVFDNIPGWETTMGNSIEIQRNTIVNAQSGDQYVELDSYGNSAMTQSLHLEAGTDYLLSFYYIPRTNRGNNDNGIGVFWDIFDGNFDMFDPENEVISIENQTRKEMPEWMKFSAVLHATSSEMALSFAALGASNSYGGFIDNVSLEAVPEPAAVAIFGLGLAAIAGHRKLTRSNA
ncbi:hypothetical protein BTA51_11455 [Hahella sp. CCB-MM4]|uniref:DUF642 domain-containing protein n=1 Tax=Hahella sp. (strain CCB-MM4) TaxID=1926491 RepID=UPI000B9B32C6|nr:DUF642 domain-containing protein [Hahella sp. CCB-MM4]OZG73106.1 hypothetical protein BTA51_11455 [Hahella sp. CCB-MM4]